MATRVFTLGAKTMIAATVVGAVLLAALGLFSLKALLTRFDAVEQAHVDRDLRRAIRALDREVGRLHLSLGDWVGRETIRELVRTHDPGCIGHEQLEHTFCDHFLDFVVVLDPAGKVALGEAYDHTADSLAPLPPALLGHFTSESPLIGSGRRGQGIGGLLLVDGRIVLVASRPTARNKDTGPAGTVVLGKYWSEGMHDRLVRQTELVLWLTPERSGPTSSLPMSVSPIWLPGSPPTSTVKTQREVITTVWLGDIYGETACRLVLHSNRAIHRQGTMVFTRLQFLLALLTLGVYLSVLVVIHHFVLRPVQQLTGDITEISDDAAFDRRVSPLASDELGGLAAEVNRMLGVVQEAEKSIDDGRLRLAQILDSISAGVMTVDASSHEILDVNAAVATMVGCPKEDIVGKMCHGVVCPAHEGACPITAPGQECDHAERTLLAADGTRIPILKTVTHVQLDGRACLIESFVDISERKAAEASLREAQKLEAVGTLAGGVAHEINNPINGIMNYAQLIIDRLPPENSSLTEYAREIIIEVQRVADIVRGLLSFARRDTTEGKTRLDIGTVIAQNLALANVIIRRDAIVLNVDVPEGLPAVSGREQPVAQVLMNLITNARDALNARYGHHHPDKVLNITAEEIAVDGLPWVRVAVEDRGCGIPDDVAEKVWDPFFTTKGRAEGTGLGLSISHNIVEEHGGKLTFTTTPGEGTTFFLDLPVASEED
ncbi:MAG: PAS domain-containing protein [Lentisphaerae bacterium]|jgi:PAS domain S-box-containing protein|nr:PAS domain-containing protein [Lentisphaerota bacterium]MBT4821495.1 PAS domain-containing protein [Lentisphaerota bacterium]MBT5605142.1 PAS domain-containing protein [Lentisphaerota bacterium]MBT7060678.1 PAS domain-containing protein [Lentisphaerota bacterium]MBT7840243.1 PAS domain-containing protein [Lentisphaerota bacterium]